MSEKMLIEKHANEWYDEFIDQVKNSDINVDINDIFPEEFKKLLLTAEGLWDKFLRILKEKDEDCVNIVLDHDLIVEEVLNYQSLCNFLMQSEVDMLNKVLFIISVVNWYSVGQAKVLRLEWIVSVKEYRMLMGYTQRGM